MPQDVERYKLVVTGMCRALMDRDTAPALFRGTMGRIITLRGCEE